MDTKTQLITRQCQRWELERRLERLRSGHDAEPPPPISIAISRQRGCRGNAIAAGLASRYGYECLGRELLELIANDNEVRRRILDMLDERKASAIRLWSEGIVSGRLVDQADFVRYLAKTIRAIHLHGGAVFVGRGADCVLDGMTAVRLFLCASFDARIDQVATELHVGPDEARLRVLSDDAARSSFIRNSFGVDWADPANYDLVLNVEHLSDDAAIDIIDGFVRRSARERWPDAQLGAEPVTPIADVRRISAR